MCLEAEPKWVQCHGRVLLPRDSDLRPRDGVREVPGLVAMAMAGLFSVHLPGRPYGDSIKEQVTCASVKGMPPAQSCFMLVP